MEDNPQSFFLVVLEALITAERNVTVQISPSLPLSFAFGVTKLALLISGPVFPDRTLFMMGPDGRAVQVMPASCFFFFFFF